MLGIDQHSRLKEIKRWLENLENGVKGEVERRFNESLAHPQRWVDIGYANILRWLDEAKAHNAPIREARELEYKQRQEEREAKRIAKEQAYRTGNIRYNGMGGMYGKKYAKTHIIWR